MQQRNRDVNAAGHPTQFASGQAPSRPSASRYSPPTRVPQSVSLTGVRANNQDAVREFPHGVILSDGMGGLPRGADASQAAVVAAAEYLGNDGRFVVMDAREAVTLSDVAVSDLHKPDSAPGATMVVAGRSSETGEWVGAYLGDSTVYVVRRDRTIEKLTQDHAAPDGRLTKWAGSGKSPSTFTAPAAKGDRLVVCTDGMGTVPDERIAQIVSEAPTNVYVARQLAEEALTRGSDDNVTVFVSPKT